jgi:hypothetical protein
MMNFLTFFSYFGLSLSLFLLVGNDANINTNKNRKISCPPKIIISINNPACGRSIGFSCWRLRRALEGKVAVAE